MMPFRASIHSRSSAKLVARLSLRGRLQHAAREVVRANMRMVWFDQSVASRPQAVPGQVAGLGPPPDRPQRRQDRKVEAYRGGLSVNHKPQASGDESESPSPTPQPGPKFLQKEHLRPSLPRSYGKDWPFWPEFHSVDGSAGRRRADRWCICRSHFTGNGSISPGNVIPSGCRPSRIASTMAGASSVGRSRRET